MEASREVAFLSKTLATIDVNVPVELDLASAEFANRPFLTPEAEAFFLRLGFKSLLPKRDVVLRDSTNLGVECREIFEPTQAEAVFERIFQEGKCTFSSFSEKGRFAGCVMGIGGEYFAFRSKTLALAPLLRRLLDSKVEIRGFDVKSDLRTVYRYLEDGKVAAEEAQGSLF